MDIDSFVAKHDAGWRRLQELARRARRPRSLSALELDELVQRYQATSSHLSYARTYFRDAALTGRLTELVAAAHAAVYGGPRRRGGRAVQSFFTTTFPAAVWSAKRFIVVSAALTFLPALALALWLANSRAALEASAPAAVRQAYLQHDFAAYYRSEPAAQFATKVFVNNVEVAIIAFAAGILLCAFTAALLAYNGANLGFAAGLFANAGQLPKFFGLILPHGVLELSAVVIAGAAGLRLGWTIVAPGDRRRADALAEEGKRSVSIIVGLIVAFGVAGTIEGFVTGSNLPTWVRVGIGLAAGAAFWLYLASQGSRALAAGYEGALSDDDRGLRSDGLERADTAPRVPVTAAPTPAHAQSLPTALTRK